MTLSQLPSLLRRSVVPTVLGAAALLLGAPSLRATMATVNTPVAPRITQRIDDAQRTTLHGNTLPLAKAQYDHGAVPASTPADRMMLVLKRSDAQEAELKKLIADQHNPASPSFHQWLKPAEFGKRFGIADSDVETIKAWLQAKGFTINKVGQGKHVIDISGTAGQLKAAFHTELHTYVHDGVSFHANNKDPEIPTALAGVVKGFASLNDLKPQSNMKLMGRMLFDPKTHRGTPQWNDPVCDPTQVPPGNFCTLYIPTPADMAVQYGISSTYSGGNKGDGETIGILSASNVDLSNVQNYRTTFGIGSATNLPEVIVDGNDPGQNGAATEAYLDVEVSGGLAPNAAVNLYVGADTNTTSGLYAAMVRAVDDDVADVISLSYGSCEQSLGSSGNQFFYYVWQQAAAQGESVFVSAGDGGSAGCDNFDTENAAQDGLAISGFASTPYNTAVGGTDFYYTNYAEGALEGTSGATALDAEIASYWGTGTQVNPTATILKTIPEQPWNNSLGLNLYGDGYGIVAGSGGASSCAFGVDDPVSGQYDSCTGGYAKPSWQAGPGVPSDGVRDIPDVSLFAANGVNDSVWPICVQTTDCNGYSNAAGGLGVSGVGGTSASSPATAGIMALIDQSQKGRQGNANFYFYSIAAQDATAFNDVTVGSNNVICTAGTPNCSLDTNGDGYYSLQEYPATPGYDLASGLGTPNVGKLIADWSKVTFTGTTTTLALSATSVTHGTPINATATVTGSGSGSGPSGSVALVTSDIQPNAKGQGTIAITNGTGTAPIYLPGGSYSVTGVYSGDGIYGASDSSAVSVTVTPENSTTTLLTYLLNQSQQYQLVQNGGSYPYGQLYSVDADIVGASGYGAATGTVTFYDNGNAIGTATSNSSGVAEFNYSTFGIGSHSVTAAYAGDPSFNPSTSAAETFSITRGTAQVYSEDNSSYGPVLAGQSFSVPVIVVGSTTPQGTIYPLAAAPTGSVTVTLGSQSQTLALTSQSGFGSNIGYANATFTNNAVGAEALTISYTGDTNYAAATATPETVTFVATTGLAATTTTASVSSSTVGPDGVVTLSAVVAGAPAAAAEAVPTGTVYFYANGLFITSGTLDPTGTTIVGYFTGGTFLGGANAITAQYFGDKYYAGSTSAPVTLTANSGDYSFTTPPIVTVTSGDNVQFNVLFTPLQGLVGPVSITCTPSDPRIICSFPGNLTFTTDGTPQTLTFTLITHDKTSGLVTSSRNGKHMGEWLAGGGIFMAMMFLGFPARRRTFGMLFTLLMLVGIGIGASGCGGGSKGNPYGPSTGSNVPAGTYTVAIKASASGIVHQQSITVVVQ